MRTPTEPTPTDLEIAADLAALRLDPCPLEAELVRIAEELGISLHDVTEAT